MGEGRERPRVWREKALERRWTRSLKARAKGLAHQVLPDPSSQLPLPQLPEFSMVRERGECKRQGWVRATGGEQRKIRGGAQIRQGEGEACRERGGRGGSPS